MQEEGYPPWLFSGPLLVTLLLDLLRHSLPDTPLRKIRFRATRPTTTATPLTYRGKWDAKPCAGQPTTKAHSVSLDAETGATS